MNNLRTSQNQWGRAWFPDNEQEYIEEEQCQGELLALHLIERYHDKRHALGHILSEEGFYELEGYYSVTALDYAVEYLEGGLR